MSVTCSAFFGLLRARKGIFAVQGNWDYSARVEGENLRRHFAGAGVTLLINERADVQCGDLPLSVLGLDYPSPGDSLRHLQEGSESAAAQPAAVACPGFFPRTARRTHRCCLLRSYPRRAGSLSVRSRHLSAALFRGFRQRPVSGGQARYPSLRHPRHRHQRRSRALSLPAGDHPDAPGGRLTAISVPGSRGSQEERRFLPSNVAKPSPGRLCAPSHSARSGSGWTSTMMPCAPATRAALAMIGTSRRLPVA